MLKTLLTLLLITFSSHAEEVKTDKPQELAMVEDDSNSYGGAAIQILNKTNAKAEIIEAKLNKRAIFGNIAIIVHRCWQAPLDQKPENKMLIEVFETKPAQPEKRIFYGWIFASSPSISGLEHPVYDITAINCKASKK